MFIDLPMEHARVIEVVENRKVVNDENGRRFVEEYFFTDGRFLARIDPIGDSAKRRAAKD